MNQATLIQGHEGLRLKPYVDTVGKMTIGYGRNLTDVGISIGEAEGLFQGDLRKAVAAAAAVIPSFGILDPVRQAVCVDAAFTLGQTRLAQFRAFIDALGASDWAGAAYGLTASRWHDEATARVDELAQMIKTGLWPGEVGQV